MDGVIGLASTAYGFVYTAAGHELGRAGGGGEAKPQPPARHQPWAGRSDSTVPERGFTCDFPQQQPLAAAVQSAEQQQRSANYL